MLAFVWNVKCQLFIQFGNVQKAKFQTKEFEVFLSLFTVYDTNSRETFDKLEEWLNEVEMYSTKKDVIKMLVGNKIDKVIPVHINFITFSTGNQSPSRKLTHFW